MDSRIEMENTSVRVNIVSLLLLQYANSAQENDMIAFWSILYNMEMWVSDNEICKYANKNINLAFRRVRCETSGYAHTL